MTSDRIYELYMEGITASSNHKGDVVRPGHPQYPSDSPEYVVWLLGFDHGIQGQQLHQRQSDLARYGSIIEALQGFKQALDKLGEP